MSGGTSLGPSARVSTSRLPAWQVERRWQAISVLSVGGLTIWYFAAHQQPSSDGYRGLTMALGWTGVTLAMLAMAFSIRKRLAYQGVGRLASWMSAHIYLGIVSAVAIVYHAAFRMGGPLTASLLALFWFTVVSGLLGWGVSRGVPRLLTAFEEKPAILEDLLAGRSECIGGMLELSVGASPEFRSLVERRLMKETVSWPRMFRFYAQRSTLDQELPAFQGEYEPALLKLKNHEHRAFRRAIEYALRANKMNAELFLQRLLRGWLTLHITCTAAMFGLAAVHIVSVLYF